MRMLVQRIRKCCLSNKTLRPLFICLGFSVFFQAPSAYSEIVTIDLAKLKDLYTPSDTDTDEAALQFCKADGFGHSISSRVSTRYGTWENTGFSQTSYTSLNYISPQKVVGCVFSSVIVTSFVLSNLQYSSFVAGLLLYGGIPVSAFGSTDFLRALGNHYAYKFDELKCQGDTDFINPEVLSATKLQSPLSTPEMLVPVNLSSLSDSTCAVCREHFQNGDKITIGKRNQPLHVKCLKPGEGTSSALFSTCEPSEKIQTVYDDTDVYVTF